MADLTTGWTVLVVLWNDNSVVTAVSNCHGIEPVATAKRWSSAQGKSVEVTQPASIDAYNQGMGVWITWNKILLSSIFRSAAKSGGGLCPHTFQM